MASGLSRTSGLVVALVLLLVLAVVAVLSAGAAFGWYEGEPEAVEALERNGHYNGRRLNRFEPVHGRTPNGIGDDFSYYDDRDEWSGGGPMTGGPLQDASMGQCRCNTSQLMQLVTAHIPRGPPGIRGRDGKPGAPGLSGNPGPQGERGIPGRRGDKGERGEVGPQGKEGLQGPKGESGLDGQIGPVGPPGPPGPPGNPGFALNRGDHAGVNRKPSWGNGMGVGYQMSQLDGMTDAGAVETIGLPGPMGPPGAPGFPGPPGLPGAKGAEGPKGERGYEGMKGDKGTEGIQGPAGRVGDKGTRGPPGIDGIPGRAGLDGMMGLKGQKGDPGPTGVGRAGPRGPKGLKGSQFYSPEEVNAMVMSTIQRFTDTSPDGPEQLRDVSKRIEVSFPKGEPGEPGMPGLMGLKGEEGPIGPIGPQGQTGNMGPRGEPGSSGEAGEPGDKGSKGEPGPPGPVSFSNGTVLVIKGQKGDSGGDGLPGRRGLRGLMGQPGPRGPPGPPGSIEGFDGDVGGIKGQKGEQGPPGPPGPGAVGGMGRGATYVDGGLFGIVARPRKRPGFNGNFGGDENGETGVEGLPVMGPPGPPGPMGPRGLPGPPGPPGGSSYGEPNMMPVPGPPGPPGERGAPGLPGGSSSNGGFGLPLTTSSTITFTSRTSMIQDWSSHSVGALAYVVADDSLFVRTSRGWREVMLGTVLTHASDDQGPIRPLTPAVETVPEVHGGRRNRPSWQPNQWGDPMVQATDRRPNQWSQPSAHEQRPSSHQDRNSHGRDSYGNSHGSHGRDSYGNSHGSHDQDSYGNSYGSHGRDSNGDGSHGRDLFGNGQNSHGRDSHGNGQGSHGRDQNSYGGHDQNSYGNGYDSQGNDQDSTRHSHHGQDYFYDTDSKDRTDYGHHGYDHDHSYHAHPGIEPSADYENSENGFGKNKHPVTNSGNWVSSSGEHLRLAALNEPVTGDLRGQKAADFSCYRQARSAGLTGSFRAFLADSSGITSLVRSTLQTLPVVNLMGETILSSWQDLSVSGGLFLEVPKIFSFDGNNVAESERWPNKYVWHGATRRGEKADNCNAWTSASAIRVGHASSLQSMQLLAQEKIGCDNRLVVLCIETNLPKRRRRSLRRKRSVLHPSNATIVPDVFLWDTENQSVDENPIHGSKDIEIHESKSPEETTPRNVSRSLVKKPVGPSIKMSNEDLSTVANRETEHKSKNKITSAVSKEPSNVSHSDKALKLVPVPSPDLDENFREEQEERQKLVNKKIFEMMGLMENED